MRRVKKWKDVSDRAMKLTDLKPEWVTSNKSIGSNRKGTAIFCQCPCGCSSGLVVPLANPLDGGPPDPPEAWGNGLSFRWNRKGEDFATISITPSILMWQDKKTGKEHWHGFITNGVIL